MILVFKSRHKLFNINLQNLGCVSDPLLKLALNININSIILILSEYYEFLDFFSK